MKTFQVWATAYLNTNHVFFIGVTSAFMCVVGPVGYDYFSPATSTAGAALHAAVHQWLALVTLPAILAAGFGKPVGLASTETVKATITAAESDRKGP